MRHVRRNWKGGTTIAFELRAQRPRNISLAQRVHTNVWTMQIVLNHLPFMPSASQEYSRCVPSHAQLTFYIQIAYFLLWSSSQFRLNGKRPSHRASDKCIQCKRWSERRSNCYWILKLSNYIWMWAPFHGSICDVFWMRKTKQKEDPQLSWELCANVVSYVSHEHALASDSIPSSILSK